nr:MAG: replication associated protein [Cressdnaviricota sp.]
MIVNDSVSWKPINGKQIYFTYSLCPLSRETVLKFIKEKLGDSYESAVICQEEHEPKEGDDNLGLHLHGYILLNKQKHIKNCRFFDIPMEEDQWYVNYQKETIKAYHPNIQPVKSKAAVLKYVTKYDMEVLCDNFDVAAYLESVETKKGYTFHIAAKDVLAGKSIEEMFLDEGSSGFVLNHKRKLEEIMPLVHKINHQVIPFPGLPIDGDILLCEKRIKYYTLLNEFMRRKVGYGDKHIFVSGPTKTGKSSVICEKLTEWFTVYSWCYDNDKQDPEIANADIILIDEFAGQIKVTELIKLLDMAKTTKFCTRYGGFVKLKDNVHVIITAQLKLKNTYTGVHEINRERYNALRRRLTCVSLSTQYPLKDDSFDELDESDSDSLSVDLSYRINNRVLSENTTRTVTPSITPEMFLQKKKRRRNTKK